MKVPMDAYTQHKPGTILSIDDVPGEGKTVPSCIDHPYDLLTAWFDKDERLVVLSCTVCEKIKLQVRCA